MGASRYCDGTSHLYVNSSNVLSSATECTFSMWLYNTNTSDTNQGFIAQPYDSSFSFINDIGYFELQITGTGGRFIRRINSDTIANLSPNNEWHHIAMTWDYNSGTPIFDGFVDGVSQSTSYRSWTDNVSAVSTSNQRTSIGKLTYQSSYVLIGNIAYAQIFDRALSENEIKELMYNPDSISNNLVGYWKLLGDLKDYSINKNDLTNSSSTESLIGPPVHFPQMQG